MSNAWRISKSAQAIEPSLIRVLRDAAKPTSLDLGIGQTDLEIDERVVHAMQRALEPRRAPYGPNLGLPEMRAAVASRYSLESASEVMITCGVQEALAVAFMGLVDPGDEVLIPDPGFPAYANLVRCVGASPIYYPLSGPGHDLEWRTIEPLLGERTRAILINTPGNPTGGVHQGANMIEILSRLAARGITWMSDEIYEDYVYEGVHISPADDPVLKEQGVRLSGMSKSHHMMGWRIGWMTGPAALVEALKPLHQHLVTSAATITQLASCEALAHHEAITLAARETFVSRRDLMVSRLNEIDGLEVESPRGAFYIWMDVHRFLGERDDVMELAMDLLEQEDVVTVPGTGFGPAGAHYLRLAYTIDEHQLDEAARRMKRFFARRRTEIRA